jgi:hypothetical protein
MFLLLFQTDSPMIIRNAGGNWERSLMTWGNEESVEISVNRPQDRCVWTLANIGVLQGNEWVLGLPMTFQSCLFIRQ